MLFVLLVVCILMPNVGAKVCSKVTANECLCFVDGTKMCCARTIFEAMKKFGELHGKDLEWNDDIEKLAKRDLAVSALPHMPGYADATLYNEFGTTTANMDTKVAETIFHDTNKHRLLNAFTDRRVSHNKKMGNFKYHRELKPWHEKMEKKRRPACS
ncbi:hypothetical protein OSTOST_10092 [Ostertagia ostertagi]